MKYLYKNTQDIQKADCKFQIKKFTPEIFGKKIIKGENLSFKAKLVRNFFVLFSKGKMQIYYAVDENGTIMHTSQVLPKFYKFGYMQKGDYVIGPCVTRHEFRGKGIYPCVLKHILNQLKPSTVYMVVDETNPSSIKGIEKAGFIRYGIVKKTKFLKKYYLVKE